MSARERVREVVLRAILANAWGNDAIQDITTRIITALAELTDEQAEAMARALCRARMEGSDGPVLDANINRLWPLYLADARASHAAWIKTLEEKP